MNCGLFCSGWPQSNIERKRKETWVSGTFARESKKTVNRKNDGHTHCNWCSWYKHENTGTRTGRLGN